MGWAPTPSTPGPLWRALLEEGPNALGGIFRQRIEAELRVQEVEHIDPDLCLLEQGIPCNGPATRSGCSALCPQVGAQCIGCYGPAEGAVDFGARLMTAFASVIDSDDPDEIERILDGIPDAGGQFYRFSLAKSLLGHSKVVAGD